VDNKASIATSDICTRDTEDSHESNNGEIPAELIEDFRHDDSEQLVDVIHMFTRYIETMLQESEQKVEKNCRGNENHKVSDPTGVRGSDSTGDTKATNDICTRVAEDSDESDNGEIPAELIETFRHDNTEDVIEDMQTRYSEKESEQKVEKGSTNYEGSEPTGDTKAGMMELQFSRAPVVSLIFEDTLDGDTETFKSDLPTCSGDPEEEQEDQANRVSCEIARNENSLIEEDLD